MAAKVLLERGQKSYPGRQPSLIEEEGPPDAVDLDGVPGVGDQQLQEVARRGDHSQLQRTSASSPLLYSIKTLSLWEVPTPNPLLWVPSCLPKSTRGSP